MRYITALLFGLGLLTHTVFAQVTNHALPHCVSQQEKREVRGSSMQGLLQAGQQVVILRNYYDCRPVQRDDWVAFHYPDVDKGLLIIKRALGLPGDQLNTASLPEIALPVIQVNRQTLYSPTGEPYVVNQVGGSYLALALRQTRNNIIPRGRYWVLGTAYADGWDSRRFGFIPHQNLLGKALLPESP